MGPGGELSPVYRGVETRKLHLHCQRQVWWGPFERASEESDQPAQNASDIDRFDVLDETVRPYNINDVLLSFLRTRMASSIVLSSWDTINSAAAAFAFPALRYPALPYVVF